VSAARRARPASEPVHLLSMHVTRVRNGRVVEEREVHVTSDTPLSPYELSSAWPPCQCPRHGDQ
jgi:hypothetical protein